jgi:2-succinyl-5-enolpyruvyl-6-hydroxy-3-cyclohexene-1-carboxylate synthase
MNDTVLNNMQLSAYIIQSLLDSGVSEFCLCAGARNASLVKTFEKNAHLKIYHFFEERSAAFFALGRIQQIQKPVVVVTTSGTAVAELLPAVIEAHYTGLSLILLTADRPKNYRGTGAPQAIEHMGIFSNYVRKSFDLDAQNYDFAINQDHLNFPLHLNVCFDEPLIDQEPLEIQFNSIVDVVKDKNRYHSLMSENKGLEAKNFATNSVEENSLEKNGECFLKELDIFLKETKPLIILSALAEADQPIVIQFLESLQLPLFVEGISGLRNHPRIKKYSLLTPEKITKELFLNKTCNSILRIGGVPTTRFWRDLEFELKNIPVLSISNNLFSGLSRPSKLCTPIQNLKEYDSGSQILMSEPIWKSRDEELYFNLNRLFEKYPESEPALVNKLSKHLHHKNVYLGNSLPIREWDLAICQKTIPAKVFANRGANGIDGQVSTFLGWASSGVENWAILGDLTALYDLSSLWITRQLEVDNLTILVINNGGGMIFNKIFESEYFLNRHEINFSSWAKMWNWHYEKWQTIPSKPISSGFRIIEMVPVEEQTKQFWLEWDKSGL